MPRLKTLLVCGTVYLVAVLQQVDAVDFTQVQVIDVDPKAVCNDGTPGIFYYRAGSGAGAKKWVIRMEGGGWCYDLASCASRLATTPILMSSQGFLPTLPSGGVVGVLNGDPAGNPSLYNWNHVSAIYCSSDSFMGDVGPADSPQAGNYQFRGKRIITSIVSKLISKYNLTMATDILISGESAGGVAAMNNAGFIQSMIAPKATSLKNFKCLVDAGWFLDTPSYSGAADAFTFQKAAQGLQLNWKASFDKNCTTQYGDKNSWACFFAQYAWPYIPVQLLFHEMLYDTATLTCNLATTPAQIADFRTKLTTTLTTPANKLALPASLAGTTISTKALSFLASPNQLPAVFAPAKTEHTIIENVLFATDRIGTTLFTGVLDDWFSGKTTTINIIDPTVGVSNS